MKTFQLPLSILFFIENLFLTRYHIYKGVEKWNNFFTRNRWS